MQVQWSYFLPSYDCNLFRSAKLNYKTQCPCTTNSEVSGHKCAFFFPKFNCLNSCNYFINLASPRVLVSSGDVSVSHLNYLKYVFNCAALLVGRSRDQFPVVSLGIFSVLPPREPCALRSTQPLKLSTSCFSWGKVGRCVWLTNYHPRSAETSRKSGALSYPEPLGPPRSVEGDLYFYVLRSQYVV